jgi:nicotinate phosphoribosyltransferase
MISALSTDFYELTMAAGYWSLGMTGRAEFELFVRRLPPSRGYLIVAGLESAIAYLNDLRFTSDDRAWLRAQPQMARIADEFFDTYLRDLRFSGDVWALPEGTAVFAGEPILRVSAPLPEAQIVETALLSTIGFPTSVATKAARIVTAADGRSVIDFGVRRAHGLDAGMAAARAAFIGGCDATSFVEAARAHGVPASGTMAHSWVQAFPSEMEAFAEFARLFGNAAVYLLDTYDTSEAAAALAASNLNPQMVRLDSGDLDSLSRQVRATLDRAGLSHTRIFATGDLDEYRIADLVRAGAPIDGFGVGTALTTVSDAPALAAVYKLVALDRGAQEIDVVKLSPGKETYPGAKQIWRRVIDGRFSDDLVTAADAPPVAGAFPLLAPMMKRGAQVGAPEPLAAMRARRAASLALLAPALMRLDAPEAARVTFDEALDTRRSLAAARHENRTR